VKPGRLKRLGPHDAFGSHAYPSLDYSHIRHMTLLPDIVELGHEPGTAIPVLFIACSGRSGSTLLDRILGMHDGFCSVGELRYIWERSFGENQLCGCGVPFDDCPFWREVSRSAFGLDAAQVDATTAIRLWKSLDEIRRAPWLLKSRNSPSHRAALLVYSQLLARLYRTVLNVAHDRVIVDSSGDATHGLILSQVPNIELHVVHLVRDPRAVAFSWKRARRRPEIHWTSQDMPIQSARTSAILWMMHNAMTESLSKSATTYCRLRYEDFVNDPDAALSRVFAPYAWTKAHAPRLVGRELTLTPSHTVSGNPLRFRQGPLKIGLDDEWQNAMDARDRQSVTAITWPLLKRYGYTARTSA
jgi:Sulfotransferase family